MGHQESIPMTLEFVIQYIMSFLGGGFVAAVGNWVHSSVSARRQREIDRLKEQLQSLYGPLSFFVHQNENLLALIGKFDSAYTAEIAQQNWSRDDMTQASVRADADTTIQIYNKYAGLVIKNNKRVMEILEKGWHLIDSEDIDEFAQFQVDFARREIEFDEKLKTPYIIYEVVGHISFIRPSMIDLVKKKVRAKEDRLRKLANLSVHRA